MNRKNILLSVIFIFFTVFYISAKSDNSNEKKIKEYIEMANSAGSLTGRTHHDSAIVYLNKALSLAFEDNNEESVFDIYYDLSKVWLNSQNYSITLDYLLKSMAILDKQKSEKATTSVDYLKKKSNVLSLMGFVYIQMDKHDRALDNLNKSLELLNKLPSEENDFINDRKMAVYNNIGAIYLNSRNMDEAVRYYEKALTYSKKVNNTFNSSAMYNNLGIINMEQGNYKEALMYYQKALDMRTADKDTAGMAQCYNNMARLYFYENNFSLALSYADKALDMSRKSSSIRSESLALSAMVAIYGKSKDYKKALESFRIYQSLSDSIHILNQTRSTEQMELQYEYEKQSREYEFEQQIKYAQKERQILIYVIVIVLLLSLIFIFIMLYRQQRVRNRENLLMQKLLEQENKNLSVKKDSLEQDVETKQKELVTSVMYLSKKNEFLDSVVGRMQDLKVCLEPEYKKWVDAIVSDIKSNIDTTVWEEFELRFKQVNNEFYNKLSCKYPALTPNEKRLCIFLYLNMTSKEISTITFQTIKSIEVARTRLRKKLELTHDDNLIKFIQEI